MKRLTVFCCVIVMAFFVCNAIAGELTSTFDENTEDWIISGSASIAYQSTGGNPGGYLRVDEGGGDTFEVVAPSKFYGDRSAYIGGTVLFDAKILSPSPADATGSGFGKVTFVGRDPSTGNLVDAELDLAPDPPSSDWTGYSAILNYSAFGVTEDRWNKIFANLVQIRVILESVVGVESMGFDNFRIETARFPVAIDIKPGDDSNSINLRSKTVSVAILSSSNFDALDEAEVARTRLTFGPSGYEQSLDSCAFRKPKDVNGDGFKDLVCQFSIKDTRFICGDVEGILKGRTVTGELFEGSQDVLIAPCK